MKKKIVILSAFLTPFRSGAEACAEEVPLRLKDRYEFTIVTARFRSSLSRSSFLDVEKRVRVIRVGLGLPIDKWLFPFLAPFVIRNLKPDVIHAILESFAGLALLFSRLTYPSAKRILTLQSTNLRLFTSSLQNDSLPLRVLMTAVSRIPKVIARIIFFGPIHGSAHRITAISTARGEQAKRYGTVIQLIPNGILLHDLQEAVASHPVIDDRILFAGRLEQMKGVDTLLAAFARVAEKHPTAHLVIVGDGSLRRNLEALQPALLKQGRIAFRGYLPPQRIAAEFAQASIFCGLSRSEALGNVFLEAQAAGCAVVATHVGGIPDIVTDGITGLLVPPDDVSAAAAALNRLLRDDALRGALSEAGKKNAEAYDWDVIAEEYAKVYEGE